MANDDDHDRYDDEDEYAFAAAVLLASTLLPKTGSRSLVGPVMASRLCRLTGPADGRLPRSGHHGEHP